MYGVDQNQFILNLQPGTLIIFPGYLEHEFSVDFGIEPFRFIHWNITSLLQYQKKWLLDEFKKNKYTVIKKLYQKT